MTHVRCDREAPTLTAPPARTSAAGLELVRSWVTDAAGIGDVEFEWHDFAKIWQAHGRRCCLGERPAAGVWFLKQILAWCNGYRMRA